MSRTRVVAWCIVWAVAAVGGTTWVLTRNGLSAREALSGRTDRVLHLVFRGAIAAGVEPRKNPLEHDGDAWREGGREFQRDCALCHGPDGRGGGRIGERIDPAAPNLAARDTQEMSDSALYHVIANGVRFTGMPAWAGDHGGDSEIWESVAFIRHLPQLTPDDLRKLQEEAARAR